MKNFRILIVSFALAACAHHENESMAKATSTAPGPVTKEAVAAVEMHRNVVVTVDFVPGSDSLSDKAVREIREAFEGARKDGSITKVEVAAWSDRAYPVSGQKLPKDQVNLAKARAKSLERLVKETEAKASVRSFNMAKQPNAFQKWVGTRDERVKNKLASAGIVARDSSDLTPDRKSVGMIFMEIE